MRDIVKTTTWADEEFRILLQYRDEQDISCPVLLVSMSVRDATRG